MKMNPLIQLADKSEKTREELAGEMNLTRQALHRKLKFPHRLRVEEIHELSKLLGKRPGYLFSIIKNLKWPTNTPIT